ncbi:MAG: PTS transporter subunit EIIA [Candidatus Hydrogenedens sp.]|nr:PTS transporter subunit EIIA [Candidatus Hydrogenedens sp.]
MLLTDYIDVDCVLPEMKTKVKADALRELTDLLIQKHKLKGMDAALDQIMDREGTESTGIGDGIAVPHARISGLKTLHCAVGRFKKGLDFSAIDRQPVYLVFLILFPPTQQTLYLNFIASLAKILQDASNLDALMKAKEAKDILVVLKELSQSMQLPEARKDDPPPRKAQIDLILLSRLQLYYEMYETAKSNKTKYKKLITDTRKLIDERVLRHFDRLMQARPPAVVPVEADTCQGCFMRLSTQFIQQVRDNDDVIHTCENCSRYIYIV